MAITTAERAAYRDLEPRKPLRRYATVYKLAPGLDRSQLMRRLHRAEDGLCDAQRARDWEACDRRLVEIGAIRRAIKAIDVRSEALSLARQKAAAEKYGLGTRDGVAEGLRAAKEEARTYGLSQLFRDAYRAGLVKEGHR